MRAVLDTNIVVSALLYPDKLPAYILALGINKRFEIGLTELILEEYKEVLSRGKFAFKAVLIESLIGNIEKSAKKAKLKNIIAPRALDPKDQKFLDCALAVGADYLVTGNKRHFPQRVHQTLVVSPSEFAAVLAEFLTH